MGKEVRICAHRGLSALCPENTLPSFAAALAFGADEIELDIRWTKDQRLVISHDDHLARISNGDGRLGEHTLSELRGVNIGVKHGWTVSFATPDELFSLLGDRIVYNLHVKEAGDNGALIRDLADCIRRHGLEKQCYFAASPRELEWMQKVEPDIPRCAIQLPNDEISIEDMAERYGCSRVQFWLGMYDRGTIERLHARSVSCNLYYADTVENMRIQAELGIDTLLTNRCDLGKAFMEEYAGA